MKHLLNKGNKKAKSKFSGIFSKIWKILSLAVFLCSNKNERLIIPLYLHKSKKYLLINLILAIILIPQHSEAQNWSGRNPYHSGKNWSINVNSGLTSYYGDLSIYDSEFDKKLAYESGPAVGLIFTKHYLNAFGISAQLLVGNLKTTNADVSISSDILEYNIHFRMDFIGLFAPESTDRIGILGYAGIGNFLFKTTTSINFEEERQQTVNSTRVPEFVYFFGGGFNYNIKDELGVTIDASIRQCQNDKLDNYVSGDDYDYYSYISLGLTYFFNNSMKGPPRNKSRIAHRSKKLKHLAAR